MAQKRPSNKNPFPRTEIHDIADAREPLLSAAYVRTIDGFSEGVPTDVLVDLMKRGAFDSIQDYIPWRELHDAMARGEVSEELLKTLTDSADRTKAFTARAIKKATGMEPELTATADTPAVRRYLDQHVGNLITSVTQDSRESVRQIIQDSTVRQTSIPEIASRIKQVIGLRPDQVKSLSAMGDKWKADGKTDVQIIKLYERARNKKLSQRATVIARTEAMRAANGGHQVSWDAALDDGYFDAKDARVTWVTVSSSDAFDVDAKGHSRLCPTCRAMNGVERRYNDKWKVYMRDSKGRKTGAVKKISIPSDAHPQCRCTMTLDIKKNSGILEGFGL